MLFSRDFDDVCYWKMNADDSLGEKKKSNTRLEGKTGAEKRKYKWPYGNTK